MRFTNGIPNHNQLSGLANNDHPQYLEQGMHFVKNRYYCGNIANAQVSSFSLTKDVLYAFPFKIGQPATFDRMSINVVTAQPGSRVYMAFYADNGAIERPGALLFDLGNVDTSTTGLKEIIFGSVFLGPVILWLVCRTDTDAVALTSQGKTEDTARFGTSDIATLPNASYCTESNSTFPATFTGTPTYIDDPQYFLFLMCSNS